MGLARSASTRRPLRVLVLGHEATRTGASLQLLHVVREWLTNDDVELSIVLRRGGELEPEFRGVAPTVVLTPMAVVRLRRFLRVAVQHAVEAARGGRPLGEPSGERDAAWPNRLRVLNARLLEPPPWRFRRHLRRLQPDVALVNTGTLGDLVAELRDVPVVSYVHEQDGTLRRVARTRDVHRMLRTSAWVAASSSAVRAELITVRGADADRTIVLHPFAPPHAPVDRETARRSLRRELGIPPDAVVVGACGGLYWAKDPDAFIELAAEVRTHAPQVAFAWLGGEPSDPQRARLKGRVRDAGLSGTVWFLPPRADAADFLAGLDVFALVSRKDSFGVAALEAARDGVPTVCFEAAGGFAEFVQGDAGFVVPGRDMSRFVERVTELIDDAHLRRKLGEVAARRVGDGHSVSAVARELLELLRRAAAAGSRG